MVIDIKKKIETFQLQGLLWKIDFLSVFLRTLRSVTESCILFSSLSCVYINKKMPQDSISTCIPSLDVCSITIVMYPNIF